MRTNGGLECSSHPISCWQCDLSFPRHRILCDFDVQMNNDNQEDKKKKIHLIFLCSCLPPPVYCFTDSRICYWIFLGNNSSLFTGSAGGTIASHSLNSDFFFPVCLCFSVSNLPSRFHFQSTRIFQLLWRQSKGIKGVQGSRLVVRGCSGSLVWHLSDGASPAKGYSGTPLHHNPWGEGDKTPRFYYL